MTGSFGETALTNPPAVSPKDPVIVVGLVSDAFGRT
jgi:hypothetical protein